MQKQMLSEKILKISESLNLHKTDIYRIIYAFIGYKQDELLSGLEVRIGDLIEIVPEPLYDSRISTLAYVSKEIADNRSYTYNTVYAVLSSYIDIQMEQLKSGRPVDFRGIVKIHPRVSDGRIRAIHSSVSSVLTELVRESVYINSVRVHTPKKLKQLIIGNVVNENIIIVDDIDDMDELLGGM